MFWRRDVGSDVHTPDDEQACDVVSELSYRKVGPCREVFHPVPIVRSPQCYNIGPSSVMPDDNTRLRIRPRRGDGRLMQSKHLSA